VPFVKALLTAWIVTACGARATKITIPAAVADQGGTHGNAQGRSPARVIALDAVGQQTQGVT
jgi:hypothetical protein